jgi:hypothetical protein
MIVALQLVHDTVRTTERVRSDKRLKQRFFFGVLVFRPSSETPFLFYEMPEGLLDNK